MKLLALALYTSIASAAAVRFCTGFEGPSDDFTPLFEVSNKNEDTAVLIAHITDFEREFVKTFDFDVEEMLSDDVYPICTERTIDTNNTSCTTEQTALFELDRIMRPTLVFSLINTKLRPGEIATYEIPTSGVYCAVVHQPGTERVEGANFEVRHLYGDYKLTNYQLLKLGLVLSLWCPLYFLLPRLLGEQGHDSQSTAWNRTKYVLMGKSTIWGIRMIHSYLRTEVLYLPFYNVWFTLDHMLSLLVISLLYIPLDRFFTIYVNGLERDSWCRYYDRRGPFAMLFCYFCVIWFTVCVNLQDSPVINVLVSDILGATLALVFSSNYELHYYGCTKIHDGPKHSPDNFEIECGIIVDGVRNRYCSNGLRIYFWFTLFLFASSLYSQVYFEASPLFWSYFRETAPLGYAHEPRLSYQYITALNIVFNGLWKQLQPWFITGILKSQN